MLGKGGISVLQTSIFYFRVHLDVEEVRRNQNAVKSGTMLCYSEEVAAFTEKMNKKLKKLKPTKQGI